MLTFGRIVVLADGIIDLYTSRNPERMKKSFVTLF